MHAPLHCTSHVNVSGLLSHLSSCFSFVHFFILDETLPLPLRSTARLASGLLSLRYINISPPPRSPPFPSSAEKFKETEKSKMRCCMGLFLMLLLVLAAQEAEGRVCQSQSHGYHGACIHSHNCALVCRNEGFSGGQCRGLRGRCFCTKLC